MPDRRCVVDDAGVGLPDNPDTAVDVVVDDERVWSFNPRRDARKTSGLWRVEWPEPLRPYLDGVGTVVVREHAGSRVFFDATTQLGAAATPLSIRDKAGRPLAMNKTGYLGRSFVERDPAVVEALLTAAEGALDFLTDECGIDAFLAFGGLLGAVREGRLIGHDIDLDLGYLSRHRHPADVIRESFVLERRFLQAGWRTWRFSAADFKVHAPGVSSAARWIDIFGGFVVGETFYLMPTVGAAADQVRLLPLGTIELEGHRLAAPADPESLLAATYGPGWRIPDPSFEFRPPRPIAFRIEGWMRSAIANRTHWLPFYTSAQRRDVPTEPSRFARWFDEREPATTRVVDLGCGTGRDAVWLAGRGRKVRGYDYASPAIRAARTAAKGAGVAARFRVLNFYDLRQVLALGGQLSHERAPLALYARFLPHALNDQGRNNLLLLASMCLRRHGRLYLEFRIDARANDRYVFGQHFRRALDPDAVAAEIERRGGRIEDRVEGTGLAPLRGEDPHICRMVATWQH